MDKCKRKTNRLMAIVLISALFLTSVSAIHIPVKADTAKITILESSGWLESAYARWSGIPQAEGYHAYYKKAGQTDSQYVKLDNSLVREYPGYFRADAVGLAPGTYILKIVPVIHGLEAGNQSAVTGHLNVKAHNREGFAFSANSAHQTGSGAYNEDGTLKTGAQVLYLTPQTAASVQLDVITSSKGAVTTCTGIGDILNARQKGYDQTPLAIRLIGNLKAADMTGLNSSGYLQIKGKSAYTEMNITFEGIGTDATVNGWGILIRNSGNVEVRNLGILLFPDDAISLDTANENIWIHNNDIFYGTAGSDADQAKGDGSVDIKGDSRFVTISYNHFWDSGKSSLCGMKSESGPNYITYHHNWFDHSDSRHPRVRTMTVHVYNNYFDGNAKYGTGVTMGASAFVENNFFRNCKYPMMISLQGTDIINGVNNGTFSGEDGGMIKAYGNHIEGAARFVDQNDDAVQFDAYTAADRYETVPAAYASHAGGFVYNNFDTDSTIMYPYHPDDAAAARDNTMAYAGRIGGGDLQWTFNNEVDDTDYSVNAPLMAAIRAYTGSVISIGGSDSGGPTDPGTTDPDPEEPEPIEGGYVYIADTAHAVNTGNFFTISGSLTENGGSQTVNGLTLTQGLKMDSKGAVTFTTAADNMVVTIGVNAKSSGSALKIGSQVIDGITSSLEFKQITLAQAGTYTIEKETNECYVYYVNVSEK